MRVGLDLLYLVPGETGGRETYVRELVPAMLACEPALEFVAFVGRDAGPELAAALGDRVRAVALPVCARNRVRWAIGELALVGAAARRARLELVHAPANFAPPWGPFRRVVTIHDLQYRALPEMLSPLARAGTAGMLRLAARGAHRVIVESHAAADEIVAGLGVARERIDVIPGGAGSTPAGERPEPGELRRRHGLGERAVVLCPASNLPHKNLPALVAALALLDPAARPVLVLCGRGTDAPALSELARASGIADDVRGLGSVGAAELDGLYALAGCVALPTRYEGFGMPVLEAMARGVPVACSDLPVLREVAGPAALYFDPRSPAEIAAAIARLLGDGDLAARLRALGDARAAGFSWAAAAQATLESYRRALA